MTHRPPETLPDGRRRYSNGTVYTPVSEADRAYQRRKPADPQAVRWRGSWLLPLPLLADAERGRPETRPDTDAYEHATKRPRCKCIPCRRPEAARWRAKRLRELATA